MRYNMPTRQEAYGYIAELLGDDTTGEFELEAAEAAIKAVEDLRKDIGIPNRLRDIGVTLIEPLPYIAFMSLVLEAGAVITDSGGLQEETTYLGIPCFTLRENTERPITVEQGTNRLTTPETLPGLLAAALAGGAAAPARPDYWDGRTAARCLDDLRRRDARER